MKALNFLNGVRISWLDGAKFVKDVNAFRPEVINRVEGHYRVSFLILVRAHT
jgi:hypothetical protein